MHLGQKDVTDAVIACHSTPCHAVLSLCRDQACDQQAGKGPWGSWYSQGQGVLPFARGPQGADGGDRLDLTTSEDMMTATELGAWRSAGQGSPGCP